MQNQSVWISVFYIGVCTVKPFTARIISVSLNAIIKVTEVILWMKSLNLVAAKCKRFAVCTEFYITLTVSKSSLFYSRDNLPKCKPNQLIFGRNIAERIWKKLTMAIFNICFVE